MDEEIVEQIFDELLSSLEPLETQCAALLQFMKDKGIATDEELAPYLEQAGNASEIRGRAARLRMASLISSAMKPAEKPAQPTATQNAEGGAEQAAPKKADSDAEQASPQKAGGAEPVAAKNAEPSSGESDDQSSQPQPSDPQRSNAKPSNAKPSHAQPSSAGNAGAGREPAAEGSHEKTEGTPREKEAA